MIVGASRWTVRLGEVLHGAGVPVILVNRSALALTAAKLAGLSTLSVEVLSVIGEEVVDLRDVEQVPAATPDDAYDALVCTRFAPELRRERVHQLATEGVGTGYEASKEWRSKIVIGEDMTFLRLAELMEAGASLVVEPYQNAAGSPISTNGDGWPIALVRHSGELAFLGAEHAAVPAAGDPILRLYQAALAPAEEAKKRRWRQLLRR